MRISVKRHIKGRKKKPEERQESEWDFLKNVSMDSGEIEFSSDKLVRNLLQKDRTGARKTVYPRIILENTSQRNIDQKKVKMVVTAT